MEHQTRTEIRCLRLSDNPPTAIVDTVYAIQFALMYNKYTYATVTSRDK